MARIFIGITLPEEIIQEVARIQSILEKQKFVGKCTELENLHVTLKFLGDIDDSTLETVKNKLDTIVFPRMPLFLQMTGSFKFQGRPKIIWIKVGGLAKLQKQIDTIVSDLFEPEKRFMSHLTIARIRHVKDQKGFSDYVSNMGVKKLAWENDSFHIISSELDPEGPIYTKVKSFHAQNADL